jgi:antitoxin YefM
MSKMHISEDIVPVGEFKTSIAKYLKSLHETGHHLVITQNGRPAGVLLTPSEYDSLVYKQEFISSVNKGIEDAESQKIYTTGQLKNELGKVRNSKVKQ